MTKSKIRLIVEYVVVVVNTTSNNNSRDSYHGNGLSFNVWEFTLSSWWIF